MSYDPRNVVLSILLLWSGQGHGADKVLSFSDAWTTAKKNSLELDRSQVSLALARKDRELANYDNDLKPALSATLYGQRPKPEPGTSAAARDQSYALSLNQTLWDFGRAQAKREGLDAATLLREAQRAEMEEALYFRVARAYAVVVSASLVETASRSQIPVAESRLVEQKKNYEMGLKPESDLVAVQIDLGRIKLNHQKATADLISSKSQLAVLIGYSEGANFDVALPSFPSSDLGYWRQLVTRWKEGQPGFEKRRLLEKELIGAERGTIDAAKRPVLGGQITAQESGPYGNLQKLYSAQIQLAWDIPWNNMKAVEYERVALREHDVELQLAADRKTLKDKVLLSTLQFDTALMQSDLLARQLEMSRKQKSLVKARYQSGKASALEFVAAESDLSNLDVEKVKLTGQVMLATIDLAEAKRVVDLSLLFP